MALVALFYRATLLNLAERVALVSEELSRSQERGAITRGKQSANSLRADFLHFSNYWYFDELANKDEEIEHFTMQCGAYRLGANAQTHRAGDEKLNAFLHEHNQVRSTEAVNRLAMLSMILGAGAVLTGYFGMNFGRAFETTFFAPSGSTDGPPSRDCVRIDLSLCAFSWVLRNRCELVRLPRHLSIARKS